MTDFFSRRIDSINIITQATYLSKIKGNNIRRL